MSSYYLLEHRRKPANWYPRRRDPLRVIVVHITAGLEDLDGPDASAERTARYAATTDRKVSWHAGVDSDSFLYLLPATYTAWHSQGFNSESYGVEISKATTRWAGMPPAWIDRTLANTAACLAPVVAKYDIPLRRLTRAQVQAGERGFAAHSDLDPGRRTDPGADFPWGRLFDLLRPAPPAPPVQPESKEMVRMLIVKDPESNKQYVTNGVTKRHIQTAEALRAWKAAGVKEIVLNVEEFGSIKEVSA
jgi:hypothetical protein